MRDLFNRIKRAALLAPQVATDDTDLVSGIVSRIGYESTVIEIDTGTLADAAAVFSVKVEHGDDPALADAATVDAADLQIDAALSATPEAGFQAAFDQAADNKRIAIGYLAGKGYVNVTVSPVGNAANAPLSASVLLSHARHQPAGATQVP
jgi:hypothetical protein